MFQNGKIFKVIVITLLAALIVLLSFIYAACFIPEKADGESGSGSGSNISAPQDPDKEQTAKPPVKSFPRNVKSADSYLYQNIGGSGLEEFKEEFFYGNHLFVFFETLSGDYDCTAANRSIAIAKLDLGGNLIRVTTLAGENDARYLCARPYKYGFFVLTAEKSESVVYRVNFDLDLQKSKTLPYMGQAALYASDTSLTIAGGERLIIESFDFELRPIFEQNTGIACEKAIEILPSGLDRFRVIYSGDSSVCSLLITKEGKAEEIAEHTQGSYLSFTPRSEQGKTYFYFLTQSGDKMLLTKMDKLFQTLFVKEIAGRSGTLLFDKFVSVVYKSESALNFTFFGNCGEEFVTLSRPEFANAKISGSFIVSEQTIYVLREIALFPLSNNAHGQSEKIVKTQNKVWLFSAESEKAFGASDVIVRILQAKE